MPKRRLKAFEEGKKKVVGFIAIIDLGILRVMREHEDNHWKRRTLRRIMTAVQIVFEGGDS